MPFRIRDPRFCIPLLLIVGIAGAAWYFRPPGPRPDTEILEDARVAIHAQRFGDAAELIDGVLERNPDSVSARRMAFEVAVEQNAADTALRHLRGMSADSRLDAIDTLLKWGDRSIQSGHLSTAERLFKAILEINRTHVVANDRLAAILALEGRRQDAEPYVLELIRQSRCTVGHLLILAYGKTEFGFAELARTASPTTADAGTQLALALDALRDNRSTSAAIRLQRAVEIAPSFLQAQARLGRLWIDQGNDAEYVKWREAIPAELLDRATIWHVRGLRAERRGDSKTAVRCFWEACRREPNNIDSLTRLIRQLAATGDSAKTKPFRERLDLLDQLAQVAAKISDQRDNHAYLKEAANVCERLGRPWEAAGWWRMISLNSEHKAEARRNLVRLQPLLQQASAATLASANVARRNDLSGFPLHESDTQTGNLVNATSGLQAGIAFRDDAESAGLRFRYLSGMRRDVGMRMYEFTGGGIGAVDFDGDGWPDLALTQGGSLVSNESPPHDRLFRNVGGERFEDVTSASGFGGRFYGQGLAVGDVDNDGFPDIFVANIGRNQLFHNNGDGTFTDVTESSGVSGERWSTSCVIADFNGDGLPDIYVVNYLADREAYVKLCQWFENAEKKPPNCSPNRFQAEQDRLYLNLGDGRFRDVTDSAGIRVKNGKGLGIIAADFEGTGNLNVFIANDGVANFYFRNTAERAAGKPWFTERALLSGVASDDSGSLQACMGIAVDDADGNGLLDLYVTNFYKESNTLYAQTSSGLFEDATRRWNLRNGSFLKLGFGTQFLDADRDGLPDLIVANGHLTEAEGTPYRMRTQIYRNRGKGRFEELPAAAAGEFFKRKILGRALAKLDWNRDGKEDFALMPLDAHLALLTNTSDAPHHSLSIQLRARTGARDAVGTRVTVEAGNQRWIKQLTAGDGFQAVNERQIVVGLGTASKVDRLTVEWISGRKDVYENLAVDHPYLLLEGSPVARKLPR